MLAYFDFLMFELITVFEELEDPGEQAEAIIMTIAAVDNKVPETFFKMYVDHLPVDKKILNDVLAFYSGIDEIKVICDCNPEDKTVCDINNIDRTTWHQHGVESKNKTPEWLSSHSRVRDLYYELRS
jgi:hypothetical protein